VDCRLWRIEIQYLDLNKYNLLENIEGTRETTQVNQYLVYLERRSSRNKPFTSQRPIAFGLKQMSMVHSVFGSASTAY
jgi:hypothetical protein